MCDTVDGYVPKIGGRLYGNNSLISEILPGIFLTDFIKMGTFFKSFYIFSATY